MSLPKPDLHIRINDEAMALLELAAEAKGLEKTKIAACYLEESLLGRVHGLRVAAERFGRAGLIGRSGE